MARFWHISLLIDLDSEWWLPRPAAFIDTANYLPRRSRALVHESIHYWHQLSHGYLLALAEEDWRQLRAWEQGGHPELGPVREHHGQPEGRHGFSAHDLTECLARFWEVLFVGPQVVLAGAVTDARRKSLTGDVPEELRQLAGQAEPDARSFDMAMNVSGSYGAPFAVTRSLVGQPAALLVFPFLAHFALKTMRPVQFFERFLDEVAPAMVEEAAGAGPALTWNQDLVARLYPLASERCERAVREAGGRGLLHAPALLPGSGLADNPAYAWSFQRLESLAAHIGGPAAVDVAICTPALGTFRTLLTGALTPPCVRFRDRQTLGLCELYAAPRAPESTSQVAGPEEATATVLSVQERWESLLDGLRRY